MPGQYQAGVPLKEWRTSSGHGSVAKCCVKIKGRTNAINEDRWRKIESGVSAMEQEELDLIKEVLKMDDSTYQAISAAIQKDQALKAKNQQKLGNGKVPQKPKGKLDPTQTGDVFREWREKVFDLTPAQFVEELQLGKFGWTAELVAGIEDYGVELQPAKLEELRIAGEMSDEYYQRFTKAMAADKKAKWQQPEPPQPPKEEPKPEPPKEEPKKEPPKEPPKEEHKLFVDGPQPPDSYYEELEKEREKSEDQTGGDKGDKKEVTTDPPIVIKKKTGSSAIFVGMVVGFLIFIIAIALKAIPGNPIPINVRYAIGAVGGLVVLGGFILGIRRSL